MFSLSHTTPPLPSHTHTPTHTVLDRAELTVPDGSASPFLPLSPGPVPDWAAGAGWPTRQDPLTVHLHHPSPLCSAGLGLPRDGLSGLLPFVQGHGGVTLTPPETFSLRVSHAGDWRPPMSGARQRKRSPSRWHPRSCFEKCPKSNFISQLINNLAP